MFVVIFFVKTVVITVELEIKRGEPVSHTEVGGGAFGILYIAMRRDRYGNEYVYSNLLQRIEINFWLINNKIYILIYLFFMISIC